MRRTDSDERLKSSATQGALPDINSADTQNPRGAMPLQGDNVDLIPIESQTRTIQTCFLQCLYEVPNFQRPYRWSTDELRSYWDDVVLAKGDFFFGSTVTWVSSKRDLFNDTYAIIDGQQRLTTSAIALSVVRDFFNLIASGQEDLRDASERQARATQRYLIATDDDGTEYRVIARPESMFYEAIQKPSAIPSGVDWNGSADRIGAARDFFENEISSTLSDLSGDDQIETLKQIRSNVLKARIIQVELVSQEDGFLVFETLNARGADLRLEDLLKNLLIRGGAANNADRDTIANRWDCMVQRVQEGRNPDVVDRFIWQSWNSRRTAVKEPELFKSISAMVDGDAEKHIAYLEELEADSKIYELLEYEDLLVRPRGANGSRDPFAVPEFVDSVRALAIFGVSVANSTILAIARTYQQSSFVKRSHLIEVGQLLANFHFHFTALNNSGSTGGTRSRYNRFAVSLETATSASEVAGHIMTLREKLQQSLPDPSRSQQAFETLFYAPNLRLRQNQKARARKAFISYVLIGLMKHRGVVPSGQDASLWTIEHLKPQSLAGESFEDPVFSIGNLTLLSDQLNNELQDADLQTKASWLKDHGYHLDAELNTWVESGASSPTAEQIADRAKALGVEALESVWSI